jgi:hypothetical protein
MKQGETFFFVEDRNDEGDHDSGAIQVRRADDASSVVVER